MLEVNVATRISDQGDGVANEDVLGNHVAARHADFWVIDGATSVADQPYIRHQVSDPQWHANFLATRFAYYSSALVPLRELLERAIADVRVAYEKAVGGRDRVPGFAWPLAAVSYVRVAMGADCIEVQCLALGDCPVRALAQQGRTIAVWDPGVGAAERTEQSGALGRDVLKKRIRERRIEQHRDPRSAIAGLDPASVQFAESMIARVSDRVDLILASDGIARLYNDYGLIDRQEFVAHALSPITATTLLDRLRSFEEFGNRANYKQRDDASMMVVNVGMAVA